MSEDIAVIDLDLHNDFDDKVPRIRDVDLGVRLGMAEPRNIRRTIAAHMKILSACGVVARRAQTSGPLGGRPGTEYWLNREQMLIVASNSGTDVGEQTMLVLVKAFSEFDRLLREQLPPFLRLTRSTWTKAWQDELMHELCKLRGELFTGRHPRWCARINAVVYECLLGKELYAKLKALNPSPSKGHNHHQLISPEYRTAFEQQLGYVCALAEQSGSLAELERRLRYRYQGKPLQLPLWPPVASLPSIAGPRKALPRAGRKKAAQEAG